MPNPSAPNYWDYIHVEELLALQGGLEGDESQLANDEVLFITVHQVYELWFKLILRELRSTRDFFKAERVEDQELSNAVRSLRRVVVLLRRCIDHFEVMETLTTREYLAFRDKLAPASGFQSAQMRQIEILLGLDEADRVPLGVEGDYLEALRAHDGSESSALRRVRAQIEDGPTLRACVDEWLYRTPIDGTGPQDADSKQRLDDFVEAYLSAHAGEVDVACGIALQRSHADDDRARLQARFGAEKDSVRAFLAPSQEEGSERRRRIRVSMLFITSYRELPLLAWPREVLDGLIETEQVFTIFRQRHARMVERVIGRRTGTGGSAGVDYLDQTAKAYRVFKDLWAVRTLQVRRAATPPLQRPEFYGFRNA